LIYCKILGEGIHSDEQSKIDCYWSETKHYTAMLQWWMANVEFDE